MKGSPVALADVKGDIFGIETLHHGTGGLVHQFLGQTQTPVGPLHRLDRRGSNMDNI